MAEEDGLMQEMQEMQETQAALDQLGREYLSDMPEILQELRLQVGAILVGGEPGQTSLMSAVNIAHQIKGTAGSLGFPDLSSMSGSVETILKKLQPGNTAENIEAVSAVLNLIGDIETWLKTGPVRIVARPG